MQRPYQTVIIAVIANNALKCNIIDIINLKIMYDAIDLK